jgi:hypothetical protein
MEYFIRNGELYHWGVKGMRWGVRRYQNADGSLTDAGKKRAQKQKVKNLKKARKAKATKAEEAAKRQELIKQGKIPASKMTDEELKARIERLRMEETVQNLSKNTKVVNKGREFVKNYAADAAKKIIWENAVDIGKQVAKHYGVEFANEHIGKMKWIDDPSGKSKDKIQVIDEVIFTNNKKKS